MNDRILEARTKIIHDRLVAHFLDAAVVPKPMSKFEWSTADLNDPSRVHKPYGWVPPQKAEGRHPEDCECFACVRGEVVELIVAPFCPALIAEQTTGLDDETFHMYLDVIDYTTSLHITYRDLPWEERERTVDDKLYEVAPGSMELLNAVQMGALDRMLEES